MIELFKSPNYDFIGKRKWAYTVSIIITLLGLISLAARGGLRYDIDFTGGTLIQVRFERAPTIAQIRTNLGTIQLGESIIQQFGDAQEFIIRLPLAAVGSEEIARRVQGALGANDSLGKFEIRRVEFVGPQVGRELQLQALYLVLAGLIWIAIYLAFASICGAASPPSSRSCTTSSSASARCRSPTASSRSRCWRRS